MHLRTARTDDARLLRRLLFEAVYWRPEPRRPALAQALADPELGRYVEGFGRPGDFGVVAEEAPNPRGGGWWRHFGADAPGYGFVDEATPEISLAVLPGYRGRGIGTALLEALTREATARGIERLSLSVQRDNPAVALYERAGFRSLGGERPATTMVIQVAPRSHVRVMPRREPD